MGERGGKFRGTLLPHSRIQLAQQFGIPAGRAAAEVVELVDDPAEPAVLPADPDGVEPAVEPLAALPVVLGMADLSLMELVLTSQHLLGSGEVVEPLCCAAAKPMPAIVAAAARIAIFFMDVSR